MPRTLVITEHDARRAAKASTREIDVGRAVVTPSARDLTSVQNAREHHNVNLLALGGGLIGPRLALAIVETFSSTDFGGGRRSARVAKIDALDGSRAPR